MSDNHITVIPAASETLRSIVESTPTTSTSEVGVVRKRRRSDSDDSDSKDQRPLEKMYKGEDTDTDNDMDGLFSSSLTSSSSSPTVTHPQVTREMFMVRIRKPRVCHRDDQYYFDDGSCVIRVADVLFNVHRSILSRDSSSFSTMFSLPQGDNEVEGRSDDNPIVLTGETPEEFKHFLWALYALPPELSIVTSPDAKLVQLIDIARVSHKYTFKSLETWALDAIQEYVNRKPSPILSAIPPPHSYTFDSEQPKAPSQIETADQLTRLIRLAQLCQHERLLMTMIGLLRQLMTSSVQYAYLAMKLSDEFDLRTLRGAAYLEVMQKAVVVKKIRVDVLKPELTSSTATASSTETLEDEAEEGSVDPAGRLVVTRAQQLRLLAGYYRLTSTWDKLRLTPLQFEHSHSCGATWHQQGCTQSWLEFWKEKTRSDSVMNLGLADVLGRLRLVQKDYDRWGSATYMHHDCRMIAKRAIGDLIKRVEEALPDYFAQPGESDED